METVSVLEKNRKIDSDLSGDSNLNPMLLFAHRFNAFFESTNDGIVVFNPDGDIIDANPRLLKLCGYDYNEIVSKSIKDIFDEYYFDEIWERFWLIFQGRKRRYPIECTLISKSGRSRPVEVSLSLLKNQYGFQKAILGIIRDITKRKQAERELIQSVDELQKVFDAVPTILLVVDSQRRIRRINRAGMEVLIKNKKDILNKKIGDILDCVRRNDVSRGCGFGRGCRTCPIRETLLRCLKMGEVVLSLNAKIEREGFENPNFYYSINAIPMENNGKRWCVISLEDVTAKENARMESIRLHNAISRANLELKKTLDDLAKSQSKLLESQKLEQIGLLASGLAHNLKTPLSGIKGYAQLLKLDYKNLRELDLIINEVEVMESIINNLMLKSRKGHENKEESLNINDLIRIELEFLKANMFFKHRVKTNIKLDRNIPSIKGIYGHFSQAIVNIIQNSLDAMYDSKEKVLTIRTRHDEKNIYIEISDTGCGIPEENMNKIFDVFFTTKPPHNERKGEEPYGTGLGLSSASYYIRQYGGTISVESRVGEGTKVVIQIPHNKKSVTLSNNRVLIVEDSDTMIDMLSKICRDFELEVYCSNNGEKAVKLYKKYKPHVVVTDLCMPGLQGTEMMRMIRKINPHQRVIYVTGYSDNPEFREWLMKEVQNPAMCTILKKPFAVDDFKKVMKKMIFN